MNTCIKQGVDHTDKRSRRNSSRAVRKEPRSQDPYLRLLVKLYAYLARRTGSKFNAIILKRLCQARQFKTPITLRKIVSLISAEKMANNIIVVVGTITNDIRMLEMPKKMQVCALHVTETARKRIEENEGKVITFDELAIQSPEGKGTILLRGNRQSEVRKSFGTPGAIGSHAKPKVHFKGGEHPKGRGQRSRFVRFTFQINNFLKIIFLNLHFQINNYSPTALVSRNVKLFNELFIFSSICTICLFVCLSVQKLE